MLTRLSLLLWLSQTFSRQNCKGEECVFTWCLCHREDGVKAVGKGTKSVIIVKKYDCTTLEELVLYTNSCRSLVTHQSLSGQFLQKSQVRFQSLILRYLSTHYLA